MQSQMHGLAIISMLGKKVSYEGLEHRTFEMSFGFVGEDKAGKKGETGNALVLSMEPDAASRSRNQKSCGRSIVNCSKRVIMTARFRHDVVRRWEGNPAISAEDIPFPCNTVFNAAAVKIDGKYILLLRVEDLRGHSVLALAESDDGLHFDIHDEPVMTPATEGPFAKYERKGIEDPRVTFLEGTYYVIYTAVSDFGPRLALARTADFHSFERIALISQPDNKDAALFSRKIGGRYARLDRPMTGTCGHIWISYSDDLIN